MPKPDLVAEHAALTAEQTALRKLCVEEWPIMSAEVARGRQDRLYAIMERLTVIERSKPWRYRSA